MNTLRLVLITAIAALVAGCSAPGAVVTAPPSNEESPAATPVSTPRVTASADASPLDPVSASHPSKEAADAMAKCHIGKDDMIPIERVAGMGLVPSAADLQHYVPLTGREPQLKEPGPAWVVLVKGDVQQMGGEVWTDPTCVVTTNDFGYFATGPVLNQKTGKVTQPEAPPFAPDLTIPKLAP
jgi:hypothetical protein